MTHTHGHVDLERLSDLTTLCLSDTCWVSVSVSHRFFFYHSFSVTLFHHRFSSFFNPLEIKTKNDRPQESKRETRSCSGLGLRSPENMYPLFDCHLWTEKVSLMCVYYSTQRHLSTFTTESTKVVKCVKPNKKIAHLVVPTSDRVKYLNSQYTGP